MAARPLSHVGIECDEDRVHLDESPASLIQAAVERGEGRLTSTGSLAVETGAYTGRAPKDRFIVDTPDVHGRICWGAVNAPISPECFERVYRGVCDYLSERDVYVVRALAGADRRHSRKFMVVAERASQALFARQMLVRPTAEELASYGEPDFTVLAAPGYRCDPERDGTRSQAAVLIDFERRVIVVAGTAYSGEIKKSIFSTMNYLLPTEDGVLPMHCSANMDPETGETAVFFGLSGTGKTTLSADPARLLIGDDEHGWSGDDVFNIEGGCYAKCIDLDPGPRARHLPGHPLRQPERERRPRRGDPRGRLCGRLPHGEHPRRLPHRAHRQLACLRRGRCPLGGRVPHRRRVRCAAPHRAPRQDLGHVPFHDRLHLEGRGYRAGHRRAAADVFGAVRRAVHAARPAGVRQDAQRAHRCATTRASIW